MAEDVVVELEVIVVMLGVVDGDGAGQSKYCPLKKPGAGVELRVVDP